MDTSGPTTEWRRNKYRRTRRDWLIYAGLASLALLTAGLVAAALMR